MFVSCYLGMKRECWGLSCKGFVLYPIFQIPGAPSSDLGCGTACFSKLENQKQIPAHTQLKCPYHKNELQNSGSLFSWSFQSPKYGRLEHTIQYSTCFHSSLLRRFGLSAAFTYDSYLPLIFGKFGLIWGHFQNVSVCRFRGCWGRRGQTTSKLKTTKFF